MRVEEPMSQNSDNRKRAFADVVTIDAWHETFLGEFSKVDLHAHVVFGTARVGGERESPIRFRLSVKRAEVVVVIPEFEPVSVDKSSVSRDTPEFQGRLTELIEQSSQIGAKGSVTASVSHTGWNASISSEAGAQGNVSASKKIELSAPVQLMMVTQSKTADGNYSWAIESATKEYLKGSPWDAIRQPRLKLVDERKDRSKGIPPTVRIEIRCRREDLAIDDLQIKDESLWQAVKGRAGFRNRVAAAESYIRDSLSEEGLETDNIHDIFGCLTLGSVSADSV